MKYEVVSLNTKKMLSGALKNAMKSKSLSKITVSELIEACGVNRKTFYYHFQDIYDLLKWTLEQEAIEVVKKFDLLVNLDDAISFVIDYVEDNRHILSCAYDSMGRDELRRFLCADFIEIALSLVEQAEAHAGCQTDAAFKRFLADFYTEAVSGMLINLFKAEIPYSKDEIRENIALILKTAIPSALQAKAAGESGGFDI